MSKRSYALLIQDRTEAPEKIELYTGYFHFDQFISDSKTVDAVIQNFEIIGEAANCLSDSFKEQHPEIEWHKIPGFRNRIVHDYIDTDYEVVW